MTRPHITKLADIEGTAAEKPALTSAEERQGRVVLRTQLDRTLFYVGLIAPAILLLALWLADVF